MTRRWREGCGGRLCRQFVENRYNRAFARGKTGKPPCGRKKRSPLPASWDFPRKRWQNKAPRNNYLISGTKHSTGCCAPAQRGKDGAVRHQRGKSHRRWLISVRQFLLMNLKVTAKMQPSRRIGIYHRLPQTLHVPRFFAVAQYSGHMSSLFFEEIYCFFLKKGNLNTPPRKSIFFEYPSALSLAIPTLPLLCYRNTADVYPVM